MSNITAKKGQMLWKREGLDDCVLHLRHSNFEQWAPYKSFPEYALPDPPEFSQGYSTFLSLMRKGWTTIPSSTY
jgi:hypothetical protein